MSLAKAQNEAQLPTSQGWKEASELVLYQDFWCPVTLLPNVLRFQSEFNSNDDDVFVASLPKSGTTWLKAIAFSILNRGRYSVSNTPLLTVNPHRLAPFVELVGSAYDIGAIQCTDSRVDAPISASGGRLLSTHLPFASFPDSIKASSCRVLYVSRNPLDAVVSAWNFVVRGGTWTMEEYVDKICEGAGYVFWPYWSHVLGYWKESLERPEKVLFLKYEEMKEEPVSNVKRIAEFLGFPFTEEEVSRGAVEEIVELCSLKSLKNMEVNKTGELFPMTENKSFFGKGQVGGWANYLTPSMANRINAVVEEKLSGSGLTFKQSA